MKTDLRVLLMAVIAVSALFGVVTYAVDNRLKGELAPVKQDIEYLKTEVKELKALIIQALFNNTPPVPAAPPIDKEQELRPSAGPGPARGALAFPTPPKE